MVRQTERPGGSLFGKVQKNGVGTISRSIGAP
jgi:hypothetical protein